MRAVLDANVVISGVLSRDGAPAQLLRALAAGEFEVIVSPKLLAELERALAYPKLRRRISEPDGQQLLAWLSDSASVVPDPDDLAVVLSEDPDDNYLIALAAANVAALVSGDVHLLSLAKRIPVFSPREFLTLVRESE